MYLIACFSIELLLMKMIIKYSCNKHGISSINKSLSQDLPQTHNNISDKNLWEFKAKRPA